jgi:hypothetical protein
MSKTYEELLELLRRCHPFLIHALCTTPNDHADYQEASDICDELDTFLFPAVTAAFAADKLRQNEN